jgi:hypothetical protein
LTKKIFGENKSGKLRKRRRKIVEKIEKFKNI